MGSLGILFLFFFFARFDFFRCWISVSEGRELFPWRCQIEFTELLGKFEWFTDNTFFLIIVAELKVQKYVITASLKRITNYLNIASEWEIASLGMSFETIVSQNASQVWMIGKEDAVHVPDFTLVPISGFKDFIA